MNRELLTVNSEQCSGTKTERVAFTQSIQTTKLLTVNRSLLTGEHVPKTLTKGSITADIIACRAFINNIDLLLTQKEFAVLFLLMENEETPMSAESLYEKAWKRPLRGNINTLQATISKLRKKIEPSGYGITMLRGEGYIFEQV